MAVEKSEIIATIYAALNAKYTTDDDVEVDLAEGEISITTDDGYTVYFISVDEECH